LQKQQQQKQQLLGPGASELANFSVIRNSGVVRFTQIFRFIKVKKRKQNEQWPVK
jgi:hypothetical protein